MEVWVDGGRQKVKESLFLEYAFFVMVFSVLIGAGMD